MQKRWYLIFVLIAFIISLFMILFVNKEKNQETWEYEYKLTTQWLFWFRKWVDIAWWVVLTYKIDYSDYEKYYWWGNQLYEMKKFVNGVLERQIDDRVNNLWVSDYSLNFKSLNNQDYVEVTLWGVDDIDYAKQIIWKTVKLDFMLQFEWEVDDATRQSRKKDAENLLVSAISSSWVHLSTYSDLDNNIMYFSEWYTKDKLPDIFKSEFDSIIQTNIDSIYWKLLEWEIQWQKWWSIVRYNGISSWDNKVWTWTEDINAYSFEYLFYAEKPKWTLAFDKKTQKILNWAYFLRALSEPNQTWQPWVRIDFNSDWKEIWCNITSSNVWKKLAIYVWWKNISDPVINEPICWWSTMVTFGSTSYQEANDQWKALVEQLNYTLPVPLVSSSEEKISPMLWDNALQWAIITWAIWFVAIAVMMCFMYGFRLWSISMLSLAIYLVILFWLVKSMWYAFSLSGIAAIILCIWMWVDANVLIFERLREEFSEWKKKNSAINDWYIRSRAAVRDWNLTTIFIWILLFVMWTNIFKWFWTMLVLNILLTLIIIVPTTRELLYLMLDENKKK